MPKGKRKSNPFADSLKENRKQNAIMDSVRTQAGNKARERAAKKGKHHVVRGKGLKAERKGKRDAY